MINLKEIKMALSIKTKHQNQCNLAPEKNVNAANLFAMGTCKLRIENKYHTTEEVLQTVIHIDDKM